MDQLIPMLVLGAMIFIFIGSYALNKRTPAPKLSGDIDTAACKACNIVTCARHGGDE